MAAEVGVTPEQEDQGAGDDGERREGGEGWPVDAGHGDAPALGDAGIDAQGREADAGHAECGKDGEALNPVAGALEQFALCLEDQPCGAEKRVANHQ